MRAFSMSSSPCNRRCRLVKKMCKGRRLQKMWVKSLKKPPAHPMIVLRFWLTFHVCISILHVPLLLQHNTASISMSTIPRQISTRKCTDVLGSQFRSKFAHVCALEIVRFSQTSMLKISNKVGRWERNWSSNIQKDRSHTENFPW